MFLRRRAIELIDKRLSLLSGFLWTANNPVSKSKKQEKKRNNKTRETPPQDIIKEQQRRRRSLPYL